ncbi:phage head-tail connector protein [Anaerocolumna jejuensis]|uniref:phage head-tail connector protein n=1 Tax=Anaerocolumna jejuensis TaxID=259063 RepID=UPI003F7BCF9A
MSIDKIRKAVKFDDDSMDEDIQDTIDACISDMVISGVSQAKASSDDKLILRAVKCFCKSEFSSDDKESQRYRDAYESLKIHLCLSKDYKAEA